VNVQAVLYTFFLALARLAQVLPRRVALAAGVAFATAAYGLYRLTPFRGFIFRNLRGAFPDTPDAELHATALSHLRQLTRCIVELLRLPMINAANVDDLVRFEGWEHLESARAAGKGVVLMTAHFGNWELMGAAFAQKGLPLHVLVQPASQDAFDRLFREFRGRAGVSTWNNAGPASLRPVLRALGRNEALGLLVDQHGEAQDAIVTFFDHPVSAPTGPFFFARRTGAAVVPVFPVRQPDDTHVIHISPALALTGDDELDAQAAYTVLETFIRRHPDHWLWVHDRWAREHELGRAPRALREEVPA
jgi:Kdo2-lipid IVA lauroyltransferase/acyltransferase